MMQQERQSVDDQEATMALAASVVERAAELMEDGWCKGSLNRGEGEVQEFCVHGAMNLAFQEMYGGQLECGIAYVCGGLAADRRGWGQVEAVATAILVDEANARYGYDPDAWKRGMMGVAPFNNDERRERTEVLAVLHGASERLWGMAMEGFRTEPPAMSEDGAEEEERQEIRVRT